MAEVSLLEVLSNVLVRVYIGQETGYDTMTDWIFVIGHSADHYPRLKNK